MTTDNMNPDLGKALAPDAEVFDIVEGVDDPLADSTISLDEPQLSTKDLLGDQLIGTSTEVPEFEANLDPAPNFDSVEIAPEPLSPGDIEVSDNDLDSMSSSIDMANVGELVSAVLSKSREFIKYSSNSKNSLRRALAFCDELEGMIVAGVTDDAKYQKLSLAHLELLDSIEEGIQTTKTHLANAGVRTTNGKRVEARLGDQAILYDPFCATVARILINAQVSGGKKVQDIFGSIKSKYSIDEREELQICQIMGDLGFPIRSLLSGEDMIEQHYA